MVKAGIEYQYYEPPPAYLTASTYMPQQSSQMSYQVHIKFKFVLHVEIFTLVLIWRYSCYSNMREIKSSIKYSLENHLTNKNTFNKKSIK